MLAWDAFDPGAPATTAQSQPAPAPPPAAAAASWSAPSNAVAPVMPAGSALDVPPEDLAPAPSAPPAAGPAAQHHYIDPTLDDPAEDARMTRQRALAVLGALLAAIAVAAAAVFALPL